MFSSKSNLEELFAGQQLGPLVISHLFDHGVSQGLAAVQHLRCSSLMMRAYIDLSRLMSGAHCWSFWFWHQQWMQNKVNLKLFIGSYRHNIVGHWHAGSYYKQNCQGPRLEGGAAGNQEIMMHIYNPYHLSGMDNERFVIRATVTRNDSAGFLSFKYQDVSHYADRSLKNKSELPPSAPIVKFFESYIEKHSSCVKVRTNPLTGWVLRNIIVGPPVKSVPPALRGVGVGREPARPLSADQLATAIGQVVKFFESYIEKHSSCVKVRTNPLTGWVLRNIIVGPPVKSVPPALRGVGVGREPARPLSADQLATAIGQVVKFFESYIEKHSSCVKVRTNPLTGWVLRNIIVGPPVKSVPPALRGVGVGRELARPLSDQLATAIGQVPHAKDKPVDESISWSAKAVHPALKSIYLQAATLRLCDRPASLTDSDTAPLLEQNELLERLLCNTPPEGVPPASAGTSPVTAD